MNNTSAVKCPGCQSYDSWEHIGFPCLSCQFANIVLRNPFGRRFQILLDTWLPIPSDSDCSSIDTNYMITNTAKNWDTSYETQHPSYKKLVSTEVRWAMPTLLLYGCKLDRKLHFLTREPIFIKNFLNCPRTVNW